jgi:hypothetical protein
VPLVNYKKKSRAELKCTHDNCQKEDRPRFPAVAHINLLAFTMTNAHSHSSCCSHDHHQEKNHIVCVALVRENGMDVVVFDATGIPRTFRSKQTGPPMKFCFSSHGGGHDEWLTPCLDADGNHGTPEESCFCGIATPHLHAHVHDPKQCDITSNKAYNKAKKTDYQIGWLASQTLFPSAEDASRIPITESLPKECNASLTNEQRRLKTGSRRLHYSIQHEDHQDSLVHNADTNQLHLEHDCADCGRPDVHGKFQAVGQRRWKQVQLHFFAISPRPFSLMESWMDLFEPHSGDAIKAVDRLVPSSTPPPKTTKARSQWHVQNICCASEIPLLRHALDRYQEEIEMSVNTTTKMVYVLHDPANVTAADISAALAVAGFAGVLRVDGAQTGATFSVTSILQLENATSNSSIQETVRALLQQQVDTADMFPLVAFQMDDEKGGTTFQVTHNPFDVTASHMAARISDDWGIPVRVVQDGADPAVWKNRDEAAAQQKNHTYPSPNVMMSGLLWVISMLSFIGGNWCV